MQNHYETLGLERSAQQTQIKKAYHRLALRWHPDKNREDGATNQFTQINEAYKTLSKAETKQKYDRKLQNRDDMQNLQNLISQYNEAEDFMTKEDRDFLNEFTRKCQDNEIKNKKIRKKK